MFTSTGFSVVCVNTIDDWKCDQLCWRNYGRKKLKTSPTVVKTYYVFVNPDKSDEPHFKRYTYQEKLRQKDDFVIVNNELEKEFEIFRQSIDSNSYYIPANDLLYYWYEIEKKSPINSEPIWEEILEGDN